MDNPVIQWLQTCLSINTDNLNRALRAYHTHLAHLDAPNSETDYWGEAVVYWQDAIADVERRLAIAKG